MKGCDEFESQKEDLINEKQILAHSTAIMAQQNQILGDELKLLTQANMELSQQKTDLQISEKALHEDADRITAEFKAEKAALMTENEKFTEKVKKLEAQQAKFEKDSDLIVQLESDTKRDKIALESCVNSKNAFSAQLAQSSIINKNLEDEMDRLTIENSRLAEENSRLAEETKSMPQTPEKSQTDTSKSTAVINKLHEEKMNLSQLLLNANAEISDLRRSKTDLESSVSNSQVHISTLTGEKQELETNLQKSW